MLLPQPSHVVVFTCLAALILISAVLTRCVNIDSFVLFAVLIRIKAVLITLSVVATYGSQAYYAGLYRGRMCKCMNAL